MDRKSPRPKNKMAEIDGLGLGKLPKWTGLNLDYDVLVSSRFCHVSLATCDLPWHSQMASDVFKTS